MKLRRNELCPIHKSLSCCGREPPADCGFHHLAYASGPLRGSCAEGRELSGRLHRWSQGLQQRPSRNTGSKVRSGRNLARLEADFRHMNR